jgi:hypothetical protein
VPGVRIEIVDSDGARQESETNESGVAHFEHLKAPGDAIFVVTSSGFATQRARVSAAAKNSALVFELPVAAECRPITHFVAVPAVVDQPAN